MKRKALAFIFTAFALGLFYYGARAESVCALVKLEILQKATMERVGFDAQLGITNSLTGAPLTSLQVTISIKDKNGNPADSLFFVKVGTRTNVTAIDGTGVLQPQTEGRVGWLIIPSTGAGGSAPLGQTYYVKATVNFIGNGILQSLSTLDAPITVMPQPFLRLQYVLPRDVPGDDPMTQVVESSVPYMLGLRVVNEGYGPAKNLSVESGQPRIRNNSNGLDISFNIIGTFIGTSTVHNTMLLPFGDIAPGGVKLGGWQMISELKGRFIDFQASFKHDPGLGGQLTSLIGGVSTYWLLKDVLNDQAGRDAQFDFLVSTQSTLAEGHPLPNLLIESDVAQPAAVTVISSDAVTLTGALSSLEPLLQMTFTAPGTTGWYYITANDPTLGAVDLVQVVRSDGRALNPKNFWQLSPYYQPDEGEAPKLLRIFDLNPTGSYRLVFKQSALDTAPDPVADLAAVAAPGSLRLDWTSTGEDRSSGTIYNGRYAITYSTEPAFAFSTAAAQVSISTTVAERSPESLPLTGLLGNATYYVRLALADKKIIWSTLSNGATVHTLAYPAYGAAVSALDVSSFSVAWSTAVNVAGALYKLELSTEAAPPQQTVAFSVDLSSHVFEGLLPDTTYFVSATARNSAGVDSPPETLPPAVTHAHKPSPAAVPLEQVEASSVVVAWSGGSNPGHTPYYVTVSTGDGLPALSTTSVVGLSSAVITGLTPDTTYFFSVKSVNQAGVETAELFIGSTVTAAAFPAGLAFSAVTPSSVTVAWGASAPDNPAYTAYTLELSTAQDFSGDILSSATSRGAGGAMLSSLASNTTYYARVTALDGAGRARTAAVGGEAYTASVNVPGSAPGILSAGIFSVEAAWDKAGNAPEAEFVLQLSTAADFSGTVVSSATLLSTASVSGLLSDTVYYARVKAMAGASESDYASLGSTRTLADVPGVPPQPFVDVSTAALSAAWFYNGAAQGFRLEVSTAQTFDGVVFSSQSADALCRSLVAYGLSAGTTYYARAGALGGQGSYSYALLGSTRTYYPEPTAGAWPAATGPDKATVVWGDGGNAAGALYTVEASSDEFAGVAASSSTVELGAEVSGLTPDTLYAFRVRASTDNYYSRYAALGSAVTLAPAPAAPGEPLLAVSTVSLTAGWNASAYGSGYRLEVSTDGAFTGTIVSSSAFTLAESTLTVAGLVPNTTYFLRVAGLNSAAAANYTTLGSTVTLARSPAAQALTVVSSVSVSAAWSAGDNPAGTNYDVQLSSDSFSTLTAAVSTAAAAWAFDALEPNTVYAARARAVNHAGLATEWEALGSATTYAAAPAAAEPGPVSSYSVTANWGAGANPAGTYFAAELSFNEFASVAASSLTLAGSVAFQGLAPNTTCYLRVRAVNGAGAATAYTQLASTSTLAVAPSSASYTGVGDTYLTANWLASGNPGGTRYEVQLTSEAYATLAASTVTTGTSFVFPGLVPSQAYEARVRALGHGGAATAFADLGSTSTVSNLPAPLPFSALGQSSVTANWGDNGNPGGTVYAAEASTNSFATAAVSSVTVNLFAVMEGLVPNTVYALRVGVQGVGAYASLGSTATLAAPPGALSPLTLSVNSVRANWAANGNPAGTVYEAQLSTDSFATFNQQAQTSNAFSVFNGLLPNRAYQLRVRAVNSSLTPTEYTALPSTYTYAAAPLADGFGLVTDGAITVLWTANGNPAGTQYQAQLSTDNFVTVEASSYTALSSATFSGLTPGENYYLRVRAVNANGGATSFVSLGSTVTLDNLPLALPFTDLAHDSFTAHWDANGNAADTVFVAEISADAFSTLAGSSETLNTWADFQGLVPNTSYALRVKTLFGAAYGANASTRTFAAVPSGLAVQQASSAAVTAGWAANGNPAGTLYEAQISTDAFASVKASAQTVNLAAEFTGLVPNATYYARVFAYNADSAATAYTGQVSTITAAAQPEPQSIGGVSSSVLQANWTASGNPDGTWYEAQVSTDNFSTVKASSLTVNALAVFSALDANTTHYLKVRAFNAAGTPTAYVTLGSTMTLAAQPGAAAFSGVTEAALLAGWTAGGNPAGTLYEAQVSTNNFADVLDSSLTVNAQAVFSLLDVNTTHYARVRAFNAAGTPTAYITLGSTVTLAAQPGAAAIGGVTEAALQANWAANGNPVGTVYEAQVSTNNFANVLASSLTVNAQAVFDTLAANATHYARVRAFNAAGTPTGFMTLGSTVTLAAQPQAAAISGVSESALQANWAANGNPAGTIYEAQVSTDNFTSVLASSLTVNAQAVFSTLEANTTHYARVRAFNSAGTPTGFVVLGSTVTNGALPGSLSLGGVTEAALQANWAANGNPAGTVYEAQVSTNNFASVLASSLTVNAQAVFDTLAANTTHYARVRAFNAAGTPTGFVSLGSTVTLAAQPGAAALGGVTEAALQANWTAGTNPAGTRYEAQVSTDNFTTVKASSVTVNVQAAFSSLAPNTTHYARVRAFNAAGMPTAYVTLGSTLTLAAQPGVAALSGVTGSALQANWTSNGNPAGTLYETQLSTDNFTTVKDSSVTFNALAVFSTLDANTTHYARVRAFNAAGTPTGFVALGSTMTLAAQPGAAALSGVTEAALQANWTAAGNPSGTVYEAQVSTNNFATVKASSVTVNVQAAFSSLAANTTHYARIRAFNSAGTPTPFVALGSTVTLAAQPGAAALGGVTGSALQANWTSNGNPAGTLYEAQLSTDNFTTVKASSVTVNAPVSFTSLDANTTHYLKVRAFNSAGTPTAFVALGSTLTLAAQPGAAAFSGVTAAALQANWTSAGNPEGTVYEAQLSTNNFTTVKASSITANTTALFDVLGANATHYARVRAFNSAGTPTSFVTLGSTVTLAAQPGAAALGGVTGSALQANWASNGNPAGTRYLAELSADDFSSVLLSSQTAAVYALFGGLGYNTTYYLRVAALNWAGTPTSPVPLGSTITLAAVPAAAGVVGVTETSVSFGWSANGNPAGTLYRALISTDNFATVNSSSQTVDVLAAFSGLEINTTYYLKAAALNAGGAITAYTPVSSTSTPAAVPAAASPEVLGISSVTFNWSANGNRAGTRYLAQISTDNFGRVDASSTTANTSAVFTGLVSHTTYYFRALAYGNGGPTAYGAQSSTMTLGLARPGAAADAFPQLSFSSVTVAWLDIGAGPSVVYEAQVSTDAFAGVSFSSATANTYAAFGTDTPLTLNTTYYFRVRATGPDISGSYLLIGATATLAAQPEAAAPAFSAQTLTGFTVYWTSGTPASGYNPRGTEYLAQVSTSPSFAGISASSRTLAVSAEFSGLVPGNTYYVRVAAYSHNSGGWTQFVPLGSKQVYVQSLAAAVLTTPPAGKSVCNSRVSVIAALVSGSASQTGGVRFQYKLSTGSVWSDIVAVDAAKPNPAVSLPYYLHWDVSGFDTALYDMRAVVTDVLGNFDVWPASITVTVTTDTANCDINEFVAAGGSVKKEQIVSNSSASVVATADPAAKQVIRLELPAGALTASSVTVSVVNNPVSAPAVPGNYAGVGSAVQLLFSNGQTDLAAGRTATLSISYLDADNNGVVDGSGVRAERLRIFSASEAEGVWRKTFNSAVDLAGHKVTADTSHFSYFALFATAALDLDSVQVYPNPYKPNSGDPDWGVPYSADDLNSGIIFDNLPSAVEINIYTVAGQLVAKLESSDSLGKLRWNVKNSGGQDVAPGGYLAVISSPGLKTIIKKVLIVK